VIQELSESGMFYYVTNTLRSFRHSIITTVSTFLSGIMKQIRKHPASTTRKMPSVNYSRERLKTNQNSRHHLSTFRRTKSQVSHHGKYKAVRWHAYHECITMLSLTNVKHVICGVT